MIEFSIHMSNRPGQLAMLARELGSADVNIQSLAAMTSGPEGFVKLVVDDDQSARRVLDEAGLAFQERRIVTAVLRDQPGALADMTEALAATGVNIEAMYLLQGSSDDGMQFAIAVDDPDTAMARLETADQVIAADDSP
jgi:hypothetical protein